MKSKIIKIIVSIVALVTVAATVGVSFAMWEAAPIEYTYTVNTASFVNIDIADIVVGSGKLVPKSDGVAATIVTATINIDIKDNKCKILFTASNLKFMSSQVGQEWLDLPVGILDIKFTNEVGSIITDKAPPFTLGMHTFKIQVSLLPNMDLIDPIYKNTQFKFDVRIDANA